MKILLADNDRSFLQARRDFLLQAGYEVVQAFTPLEALQVLEQREIDLAILDVRFENDDDEKDTSGLSVAQAAAQTVPKIILTGYPSHETATEALRQRSNGAPLAADFVTKQEGPEALLAAIQRVYDRRGRTV